MKKASTPVKNVRLKQESRGGKVRIQPDKKFEKRQFSRQFEPCFAHNYDPFIYLWR
jgi:hypothetical protein